MSWSRRRIEEEHNNIINQRKREQYEEEQAYEDVFSHYEYCLKDWTNIELGYKAILLKTMKEIVEEGVEMVHCVGGYAKHSYKGGYLVYKVIPLSGGERFTVGILRKKNSERRSAKLQDFNINTPLHIADKILKHAVEIEGYSLNFQQAHKKYNKEITCDKAKMFIRELMLVAQDRKSVAIDRAANKKEPYV